MDDRALEAGQAGFQVVLQTGDCRGIERAVALAELDQQQVGHLAGGGIEEGAQGMMDFGAGAVGHLVDVAPLVARQRWRRRRDLERLQALVRQRPPDAPAQLEALYHCYQAAPGPQRQGERHSAWYRMLITRLWDRWCRLTLDQRLDDLDGTNNGSERLIGWWIKERYRLMRGYKRTKSI